MKKSEKIVTLDVDHTCDLSRAEYALSLSYLDLDSDTRVFTGTFDRIQFQNPSEIVKKVLKANGYVLNFENILAGLDTFTLVHRVRLKDSKKSSSMIATQYLPAISFRLPGKNSQGDLLSSFYSELHQYANEVERLKISQVKPNVKDSEKDLKAQRDYAAELEIRIQNLAEELRSLRQSIQGNSNSSTEALPENIKLATVRGLNLSERVIILSLGRSNLKVPFRLFDHQPEIGESCIVSSHLGKPQSVVFYESEIVPLEKELSRVLYCENDSIKLRDRKRKSWVLHALNDTEKNLFKNLKRGDQMILSIMRNQVASFVPIVSKGSCNFVYRYQRDNIIRQIVEQNIEDHSQAIEKTDLGEEKWRA